MVTREKIPARDKRKARPSQRILQADGGKLKKNELHKDVSKNGGSWPPKWMVKIMENPIKLDDLGVPSFWKHPQICWRICDRFLVKTVLKVFFSRRSSQLISSNLIDEVVEYWIHLPRHMQVTRHLSWPIGITMCRLVSFRDLFVPGRKEEARSHDAIAELGTTQRTGWKSLGRSLFWLRLILLTVCNGNVQPLTWHSVESSSWLVHDGTLIIPI